MREHTVIDCRKHTIIIVLFDLREHTVIVVLFDSREHTVLVLFDFRENQVNQACRDPRVTEGPPGHPDYPGLTDHQEKTVKW